MLRLKCRIDKLEKTLPPVQTAAEVLGRGGGRRWPDKSGELHVHAQALRRKFVGSCTAGRQPRKPDRRGARQVCSELSIQNGATQGGVVRCPA